MDTLTIPTTPSPGQIRDAQRRSWDTFSPGWAKWDDLVVRGLASQADAIIDALDLQPNAQVLDIATGSGEPGLTIAGLVPDGHVTATDLAPAMLEIARAKATRRGLPNHTSHVADVSKLPISEGSFDAVSCRLGFMFFPDMAQAAREIHRVLKPGGTFATTVWGAPEHNPWITAMMGAIKDHLDVPTPPPGAPGMFRVAQPGLLAGILAHAGFDVIEEREILDTWTLASREQYWEFMNDVVPPVVAVFQDAPQETIDKIRQQVFSWLDEHLPGTEKPLPTGARLLVARKR